MRKFKISTFVVFFLVGILAFTIAIMPSVPTVDASNYCEHPWTVSGAIYNKNYVKFNKLNYAPHDSPGISGKLIFKVSK